MYAGVLLLAVELTDLHAQSQPPPQVSVLWPNPGIEVTSTLLIKIKAEAFSHGGSIAQVQFFDRTNLIGAVTNPPFNLLWSVGSGMTNADYVPLILNAVATDNLGLSSTSAPVSLRVYVGRPEGPIAGITSPQNGAVLAAPATFLLSAEVLASLGDTGPEEFFIGTNSVGIVNSNGMNEMLSATTPPVSITLSNLFEGSYNLAVDYLGLNGRYCFCDSINISVVKLAVISPRLGTNGAVAFDVVTSYARRQNVIEVSTNLLSWIPLSTNLPSGSTFTFTDASPPSGSKRFYRVLVPSQ